MAKKSTIRSNWPKWALQWGVLAALIVFLSGIAEKVFGTEPANPEALCPMGGIEAFTTYIVRGSLPCSMTTLQIVMGLALAASVILFSKLFCGYLCPIGSFEDILTKIRKAINIKDIEIPTGSISDKILRAVKYGLLFWIFYMTAKSSELFCKNLDPYYAVATGFKGEITLWMSIATIAVTIFCGIFIKRFWCRYICPLGAASNAFKFWIALLALALIYWGLQVLGLNINWAWLLAAFCLCGYLMEVFNGKPKAQLLYVINDAGRCNHICYSCRKECPYHIDIPSFNGPVNHVDCVLCGECVAVCPTKALSIGVRKPRTNIRTKFLPALLALAFATGAYFTGLKFELPTIDEEWNMEQVQGNMETLKLSGLRTVKCFGSSMAFKARMEKVSGVHRVKTFVGTHTVEIFYDDAVTNAEKIQKSVFTPSHFRVWTPDPSKISSLKIITLRIEKMYDKLDLNYLGLQFRNTGKSIFGVVSEYDCPVKVKVYMSADEKLDEAWFKEQVNKKVLAMPVHGGGVKETPMNLEFVKMEEGEEYIEVHEYLEMMFDGFVYESAKRLEKHAADRQYIYEWSNHNYEKPLLRRQMPFLSNFMSQQDGIIGVYMKLNKDYVPSIQIRYAKPMSPEKIWELVNREKWTIQYKKDDVREENAKLKFERQGIVYDY